MTQPRLVLPGSTYLVTRRCTQRQLLLKPSMLVNTIFAYCVAVASQQTNVVVHAMIVMGNHWHAVVTDPDCRLPEFMASVHKHVAKCLNATYGRFENLWSSEQYSQVRLEDENAIVREMVYVLTNPVEAGLVETGSQWPGLRSDPRACAQPPLECFMPTVFFRPDGDMPRRIELKLTMPPGFEEMTPKQFCSMLTSRIREKEEELRAKMETEGESFLGRKAILDQSHLDYPWTAAPHFGLNPRVACRDKWRRIEALQRLKSFLEAYREAWELFKAGVRDVVFPGGTYWMRRYAKVACSDPD